MIKSKKEIPVMSEQGKRKNYRCPYIYKPRLSPELKVTDGKAVSGLTSDNNFTAYDKIVT